MIPDSLVVAEQKGKDKPGYKGKGKGKAMEPETPVQTPGAPSNSGTSSEALPGRRTKRVAALRALHAIKASSSSSSSSQRLHAYHDNQTQSEGTHATIVQVSPPKKVAGDSPLPGRKAYGSGKTIKQMKAVDFVP
jgi:hypothetical protein